MIVLPSELAQACMSADDVVEPLITCDQISDVSVSDLAEVTFYVPAYLGPASEFSVMSQMPRLQVCQLPTAGFDHAIGYVPTGVTLCNAGGVHDASTAELLVGMVIARLRHVDDMARAMTTGTWMFDRFESLADKHVLIVGFGGVGQAVAARLAGFEVQISAVARRARSGVHDWTAIDRLLPSADVVILTVPLTDQTRGLVDSVFLDRMKSGAVLVNGARGPVVNTDALVEATRSGRIQAVLDVTDPEPLPPHHPLWSTPGVLISPHVGGNSSAFVPRMSALVLDQIRRWQSGRPLVSVVVS
ncbi:MAG: 2-hydroxyacid dehydrogenase [Candidatus Nanopelagicales bacterium]